MRTFVQNFDKAISTARTRGKGYAADDAGSLTIFSLFLFILILFISGMAVDLMRYESERVGLQNSIDTAVVATSSLTQDGNDEAATIALVKEYVSKAGYDADMVTVVPQFEDVAGTTVARSVSATVDFRLDTMFMNMMGIDTLQGYAGSAAREGNQVIEISLILDVSGSMGQNSKLENLKVAAKNFVTDVINTNGADRISISIVPYNQQVYMDDDLAAYMQNDIASRIKMTDVQVDLNLPGQPHAGAITTYQTLDQTSRCARFRDADFSTNRLAATASVEPSAMFSEDNIGMSTPDGNDFWCGENFPRMMLYENDVLALHGHIDSMSASGWTAIDYGLNWGVGILDPSFEPIVTDMSNDGVLSASAATHPVPYSNTDVLKYVVLMTDGINTNHFDLKTEFKSGPSPIWHSATQANGDDYAGYLVEMPNNPATERWYVPNDPNDPNDDQYLHQNAFPADAVQRDYHWLYNRFSVPAVAEYFFMGSDDQAAYQAHNEAIEDSGGYGVADTRVNSICTEAKTGDRIEIFTVAFEAPADAQTLLSNCASETGNYFAVNGTQINAAFNSIATQISLLRLTQ